MSKQGDREAAAREETKREPDKVMFIGSSVENIRIEELRHGQPRAYADTEFVFRVTIDSWHSLWGSPKGGKHRVLNVLQAATGHREENPEDWWAEHLEYCNQIGEPEVLRVATGQPPHKPYTPCYWRYVWEVRFYRRFAD